MSYCASDVYWAIDTQGELLWHMAFDAFVGRSAIMTTIEPTKPRLIVPSSDGRLSIMGEADPDGPINVWEIRCNPQWDCNEDRDLDFVQTKNRLFAAWTPILGADKYGVRLLGPNDAVIMDWSQADAQHLGNARRQRSSSDNLTISKFKQCSNSMAGRSIRRALV